MSLFAIGCVLTVIGMGLSISIFAWNEHGIIVGSIGIGSVLIGMIIVAYKLNQNLKYEMKGEHKIYKGVQSEE